MSKVGEIIKERLKKLGNNLEAYHPEFDEILEEKLMELDPEWMKEMREIYEKDCKFRWYA